ncbi:hypothetical protein PV08_02331 [Exophiala spinifera]|uniref:Uncharacterized protein n=1 Tax=Exophiala spinifera TaxID=91928 RepID=A0A0D2C381_9EURO|nr:uncharacterized protein PV08_02331 [Exophiala spinifera]KIW18044.1 hypothetical protein PV08_02331 [Exophiala spinifera]
MPGKSQESKDDSIPPPLDPFPTYQTPFPRSHRDDANPFIQFRRFADEQFSSFFQGVPRLFGFQSSRHFEDMVRERQERDEGWRKQVEQEMEEWRQNREELMQRLTQRLENNIPDRIEQMRQHRERTRHIGDFGEDTTQPLPQITPWSAREAASRCPVTNDSQYLHGKSKCHAWRKRKEQATTELDAYEALENGNDASGRQSKSWFSSFGWDGKRTEQARDEGDEKFTPLQREERPSKPVTHNLFSIKFMDPFVDTGATIPWLMLNKYSPLYLCNPSQPRMYEVQIHDAEDKPFRISSPKFFEPAPRNRDLDEKLARQLPWADAFEDLISLEQTGKMVDRDYSTWRTPSTWIHDIVHRGSLGPRWAFNQDGMLVKRSIDGGNRAKQQGQEYSWPDGLVEESRLLLGRKVSDFLDEMGDNMTRTLATSPMFSSVVAAANAIVAAAEEAQRDFENVTPAIADEREGPKETQDVEVASKQALSTEFSHAFESTFSSSNDEGSIGKRIVATTTSISQRMLPDGSVESKRIFKRRFADGTVESEESVDVTNSSAAEPSLHYGTAHANEQVEPEAVPAPSGRPDGGDGFREPHSPWHDSTPVSETQAEDTVDRPPQERREKSSKPSRGGGWFWT